MTVANPFILCNLAAKMTRKLHRQSSGIRVEQCLRNNIEKASEYLLSGTQADIEQKNLRHSCAKVWEPNVEPQV